MSIRFYMDVHVPISITRGLRRRGIDVITAQEDGAGRLADTELLDRATTLERVIFSNDEDFTREAATRQANAIRFAGVIYAHEQNVTIGQCIADLEIIAGVYDPTDMANQLVYLPL